MLRFYFEPHLRDGCKGYNRNRGGKVLIFDGYQYKKKHRQRNESIYWRCWRIECRANLKTNIFDINDPQAIIRIFEHNEHTHESDETSIYRSETLNALKDAIMEDQTVPIKRVYNRVSRVMNRGGGDRGRIPEFHRVRTSMTRARLEQVPAVPHTIDDVSILGGWRKTWAGDTFFLHRNNDCGILMFATDEELKCLQKCFEVYIDGTFRTCPRPYEQYVTIYGKYRNRVLCFVNCLMTGRQVGQYRQVLQSVKAQVRRASGHRWRPTMVISDYEQAILSAVETELPNARISGCYFHFGQNLWRKVQSLGIAR